MEEPKGKHSMRKEWFEHVRKTRAQLSRGSKEKVTHRSAMQAASVTWSDVKAKVERRLKRNAKKIPKEK